jgi:hypothetical protein
MRHESVIAISELVKDVEESTVANTNYRMSVLEGECGKSNTGLLVVVRDFNRIRNALYNATFGSVDHGYLR